ncbi:MAG: hypothetical protein JXM70_10130, partial [Pirellulales bacterium]|nr:hypothetical protein [Pirellulales bacterium]
PRTGGRLAFARSIHELLNIPLSSYWTMARVLHCTITLQVAGSAQFPTYEETAPSPLPASPILHVVKIKVHLSRLCGGWCSRRQMGQA